VPAIRATAFHLPPHSYPCLLKQLINSWIELRNWIYSQPAVYVAWQRRLASIGELSTLVGVCFKAAWCARPFVPLSRAHIASFRDMYPRTDCPAVPDKYQYKILLSLLSLPLTSYALTLPRRRHCGPYMC